MLTIRMVDEYLKSMDGKLNIAGDVVPGSSCAIDSNYRKYYIDNDLYDDAFIPTYGVLNMPAAKFVELANDTDKFAAEPMPIGYIDAEEITINFTMSRLIIQEVFNDNYEPIMYLHGFVYKIGDDMMVSIPGDITVES